jgi:hypothetical protein
MTFVVLLSCCLRELSSPDVELIFTTIWMLWNAQNEMLWIGKTSSVSDICSRAFGMGMNFMENGGGVDHA